MTTFSTFALRYMTAPFLELAERGYKYQPPGREPAAGGGVQEADLPLDQGRGRRFR
jgi:hypothetical protein